MTSLTPAITAPLPSPPPSRPEDWPGQGNLRHLPREWHERRAKFFAKRERDRGVHICFFGDSITEKWGRKLSSSFRPWRTANRGICGDTTRGLLFRVEEDVLTINPLVTVLLIGINDLDVSSSPEDIVANIDNLVSTHPNPIIICTIMPHRDFCGAREGNVLRVNYLLKTVLRRGIVVDTHSPFLTVNGDFNQKFFSDAVHPNAAGYTVLANIIKPTLKKLLG